METATVKCSVLLREKGNVHSPDKSYIVKLTKNCQEPIFTLTEIPKPHSRFIEQQILTKTCLTFFLNPF